VTAELHRPVTIVRRRPIRSVACWPTAAPNPSSESTTPAWPIEKSREPVRYSARKGAMKLPVRLTSVPANRYQNGRGNPDRWLARAVVTPSPCGPASID